ncbi:hypothetical protein [Streptosporangium canum]|uniref:hypothetical protein n=1 Tax=Streptosporangium canum TaxID=324952 RepID=UPI0033B1C91F
MVAPYSLLVPVFGMSSAALFTGEPVSPVKLAAALIISGVLFAGTRPASRTASAGKTSRQSPEPGPPDPSGSRREASTRA